MTALAPDRERWLLVALAGVQLSSVLDFMLPMPLGAQIMRLFDITPGQFGLLVSVYMITASAVGFAAALVVDRFDRRTTLLVCYACFTATTLLAASARSYEWLLAARAAAGAFGGVLGATVFAIIGDAIPDRRRGQALGFVMSAFSLASIAGIPLAIYLANQFSWRAPFLFNMALCSAILAVAFHAVPRVHAHLEAARTRSAAAKIAGVFGRANHLRALGLTMLLNFSGMSIVPFLAPYLVVNVGIGEAELPITYFFGGLATFAFVRLVGRLTDLHGRRRTFMAVAGLSTVAILTATHLPPVALWVATLSQTFLMATLSARFVPAMATVTAAVEPSLRGTFMSFNAAVMQLAAGLASWGASLIVTRGPSGEFFGFGAVGWLSVAAACGAIALVRFVRPLAVARL
jgi:predicted MFS family arabinose efflux permease